MALFASKKNTKKETQVKEVKTVARKSSGVKAPKAVLKNPRITEKASFLMSENIYVFDVDTRANKLEVAKAVEALYKVTPSKVRMVTIVPKNIFVRGKWGVKSGGKKAYVHLKKGDKIEVL